MINETSREYEFRDTLYAIFKIRKMNSDQITEVISRIPACEDYGDIVEQIAIERYQARQQKQKL